MVVFYVAGVTECLNNTILVQRDWPRFVIAPEGLDPPAALALNESTISVSWAPPALVNGPPPAYTIRRATGAFNFPPLEVTRGTRFNGKGYYRFGPDTIPQGVSFTGSYQIVNYA